MKKRILSLILAVATLLSCIVILPTMAAPTAVQESEAADSEFGSTALQSKLTDMLDETAYPAEEYPWAVFTYDTTTNAWALVGAYKLYSQGSNGNLLRPSDHGQYKAYWIAAMDAASNAGNRNATKVSYVLLRSDYTIKTKDTAVEVDVHFGTAASDQDGLAYWDAEAGAYVNTVPTETYTVKNEKGEDVVKTCYQYNRAWDRSHPNFFGTAGDVIVDLAGHKFDMNGSNSSYIELMCKAAPGAGATVVHGLKYYNGEISNLSKLFNDYKIGSNKTLADNQGGAALFNIEFNNTTLRFKNPSVFINHQNNDTGKYIPANVAVSFNGCKIDISTCGSYTPFKILQSSQGASLTVDIDDTSKIVTSVKKDAENPDWTSLIYADAGCSYELNCLAQYMGETVTEYGTIPAQYSDSDIYPFVMFDEAGTCLAFKYWTGGTNDSLLSRLLWNFRSGQTLNVLLRRDYTVDPAVDTNNADNFMSFGFKELNIDLDGNEFISYARHPFHVAIKANGGSTIANTINVKNGTVRCSNLIEVWANSNATYDSGTYLNFENVVFDATGDLVALGGTVKTATGITFPADSGLTSYPVAVSFKDCKVSNPFTQTARWSITANANAQGLITVTVDCEHSYTDEYDDSCDFCGFERFERDEALKVTDVNLGLADDIRMGFYVDEADLAGYENPVLKLHFGGQDYEFAGVLKDGQWSFKTYRFSPHLADEILTYTLSAEKDGEILYGSSRKTSVKKYCYDALNSDSALVSETAKELIADTLNYCAAAEAYVLGKTEGLVNYELKTDSRYSAYNTEKTPVIENTGYTNTKAESYTGAYVNGMAISLNNGIRFRLSEQADLKLVVISGGEKLATCTFEKDGTTGELIAYYKGANAAELRKLYTFELQNASGEVVQTITDFSFETYAFATVSNAGASDTMKALMKAMMVYGDSAVLYKESL